MKTISILLIATFWFCHCKAFFKIPYNPILKAKIFIPVSENPWKSFENMEKKMLTLNEKFVLTMQRIGKIESICNKNSPTMTDCNIDLSKIEKKLEFVWKNITKLQTQIKNLEKNDLKTNASLEQLWKAFEGKLYFIREIFHLSFYDFSNTIDRSKCPKGALWIRYHCYKISFAMSTFEEAKEFCIHEGGHLAIPRNFWIEKDFIDFLKENFPSGINIKKFTLPLYLSINR